MARDRRDKARPLEPLVPNAETIEAIKAARRGEFVKDAALDEILKRKVEASLADPRTSRPAEDVFPRLREHHANALKKKKSQRRSSGR